MNPEHKEEFLAWLEEGITLIHTKIVNGNQEADKYGYDITCSPEYNQDGGFINALFMVYQKVTGQSHLLTKGYKESQAKS